MTQEFQNDKIALFEGKRVRKILLDGEWWLSVIDIVEVLTVSTMPKRYWTDFKKKLAGEGATETYEKNRTVENGCHGRCPPGIGRRLSQANVYV